MLNHHPRRAPYTTSLGYVPKPKMLGFSSRKAGPPSQRRVPRAANWPTASMLCRGVDPKHPSRGGGFKGLKGFKGGGRSGSPVTLEVTHLLENNLIMSSQHWANLKLANKDSPVRPLSKSFFTCQRCSKTFCAITSLKKHMAISHKLNITQGVAFDSVRRAIGNLPQRASCGHKFGEWRGLRMHAESRTTHFPQK